MPYRRGAIAQNRKDISGAVFGRLTAIRPGRREGKVLYWICRCSCGRRHEVRYGNLSSGRVKSCGCLAKETTAERSMTHGMSKTPTYISWLSMMARCYKKESISYMNYGGRGIRVCRRWHKFENFLSDMGVRPRGLSLGRQRNDRNYSRSNCRWEDRLQQANNKTNSLRMTFNGKGMTLSEAARVFGIRYATAYKRIYINGWSISDALTTPTRRCNREQ